MIKIFLDAEEDRQINIFNFMRDILKNIAKISEHSIFIRGMLDICLVEKYDNDDKFMGFCCNKLIYGKSLGSRFFIVIQRKILKSEDILEI